MDAEEREAFVDEDQEPDPELNRITNAIIGAAIEVHRLLGPGHLEAAYEEAMAIEMDLRGIRYARQDEVTLVYKGHKIGFGRMDFLIEGRVVLDLKAQSAISPADVKQMLSYLAMTDRPLGLILNFHVAALRQGIKRIAGRPRTSR